jgi:hypothetical protein
MRLKLIRRSQYARGLGLCKLFFELTNLLRQIRSGENPQIVDKELAVKVIHLMLNGSRMQAIGIDFDQLALKVIRLHPDPLGPVNLPVHIRQAQAAFLSLITGMPLDNLRIDKDLLVLRLSRICHQIQNEESEWQPDLIRRQPNPSGCIHQLKHPTNRILEVLIQTLQRLADRSENRVRVLDNVQRLGHV